MNEDKGYRLILFEFDSNWKEKTRPLGEGRIYEQGERLYEGWVKKLGPRAIRLVLEDRSGQKEDRVHEF